MKRIVIPVTILLILATGYIICCASVRPGYVLPHTAVNGRSLDGMPVAEAVYSLEEEAKACCETAVYTVSFDGKNFMVDLKEALECDINSAKEAITLPGQSNFWLRGGYFIKALVRGSLIVLTPSVKSEEELSRRIAESGLLEAGTTTQTTCKIKDKKLIFTIGKAGMEADTAALSQQLMEAVAAGDGGPIACPVMTGRVEQVDLERVYEKVRKDSANATLDPANGYQIVEAVTGVDFDKESARKALEAAEEGGEVIVDLVLTKPEITTQDLQERLFADVLGTFSTKVGGTSNRLMNVGLASEKCNGSIMLKGDVFSFNDTVGEQTAETGFQTANAILDGKIVQAYGGGVCQVSSTIFAAALYANLEIKERWEHYYVPGYMEAGMDAAVAWSAQDLKLCSQEDYPVRIDSVYADGYLTVTIRGTKTDDSIVEVETETDADSGGSLNVQTYRKVYSGDKSQMFSEKVAYSTYAH